MDYEKAKVIYFLPKNWTKPDKAKWAWLKTDLPVGAGLV
jgi:hypothetical protein